jgi:hypothetical protein
MFLRSQMLIFFKYFNSNILNLKLDKFQNMMKKNIYLETFVLSVENTYSKHFFSNHF